MPRGHWVGRTGFFRKASNTRRKSGPADTEDDAQGEKRTTRRSLHLNSRVRDTIAEEKA